MTHISHIKNITSLFSRKWQALSVCGSSAAAPRQGAVGGQLRAPDRGTPKLISDFILAEIDDEPAHQMLRMRGGGGAMPDGSESDAMTKAWTYAVLDALEAADEMTRLEIARILCPAGFVIVPTEAIELSKRQKN
jgi:hypothetical protein